MRKMKFFYAEPEMELIELKQLDVITASYDDYDKTGEDEDYDVINF